MRTWIILTSLLLVSNLAVAQKVDFPLEGSGSTVGAYNGLIVEGWSYFDSRGTMDNAIIDLNFTITHETVTPNQYAGIIEIKGKLNRGNSSHIGTFETVSCKVIWGYNMCALFGVGKGPQPIKTHGDVGMFFNFENESPKSTTLFKLHFGCLSCPPLPIPTPPKSEKRFSKPKCFKLNPKRCPEGTEPYFEVENS